MKATMFMISELHREQSWLQSLLPCEQISNLVMMPMQKK